MAGTSHRIVAEAADVPLGSMTYHFDGFDDLIFQAFSHYARQAAERFRTRMEQARTRDDACEAIAETIADDLLGTDRDMVINLELYAIAARKPRFPGHHDGVDQNRPDLHGTVLRPADGQTAG